MAELDPLFHEVVAALKREDGAAVLARAPELLRLAGENLGLKGRVLAWLAQAEMFNGDLKAASQAARQALAVAREAGDDKGQLAIRGLQAQITMKRQEAAGREASPLPIDLPNTPVSRAMSLITMGDLAQGEALAREARRLAKAAGDAREEVMALLALARVPSCTNEAIAEAATVADASSDMNLVTAVAKAAKAAGIPLPPKVF